MKPGEDCKHWHYKDETHTRIKRHYDLSRYQLMIYGRELEKERKALAKLEDPVKVEERKKSYGLRFDTRKDLEEAYLVGAVTFQEYRYQKRALYIVYSDRGHLDRIEWLEEMYAKAQERYKLSERYVNKYKTQMELDIEKEKKKRHQSKIRVRRWRAKKRKEKKQALFDEQRRRAKIRQGKESPDE